MTDNPSAPATQPASKTTAQKPEELYRATCKASLDEVRARRGRILAVSGERTEANTLVLYNELMVGLSNTYNSAGLFAQVHPDKAMRDVGEACERESAALSTELKLDRGLFDALAAVDAAKLSPGTRRMVEHTLRDFRRADVDKDEPTRVRLKELADREVQLGQQFDKNIREDVRSISIDPAQLAGLPEDYVQSHPAGADGKVKITTDYPDYVPFRTYAKDAAARTALFQAFQTRAYPQNVELLRQLLEVRKEEATLLGYKDWADFITADKMAKSGAAVGEFIEKIAKAADGRAKKDLALLLARKKKDDKKATFIDFSESAYYEELVKRETYAFNSQDVRPYFEYTRVRDGLLTVTARLFGVEYVRVTSEPAWHPDVEVYDVLKDGQKLGRIYLDLHPRDGKYKHAAQFPLVTGVQGVQLPEGVLVCNFADPAKGTALMEHDDVVTLFHEFGHLMHHILGGEQRWIYFSGVATEWDFVEAPSQLLEEWAWDPTVLAMFARHHETGEAISADTVKRMRAANEMGKGTLARQQMFYAAMSLRYHTAADPKSLDLAKTMLDLQTKYSKYKYVDGTHMYANFGHLNGYSAMYYTYMWSLVIAKDLFSAFEAKGLLDPATCARYRDAVLVPGGSKDAAELVQDFLGRPYAFTSFKKWLDK